MLNNLEDDNFQFLALPKVVAPDTVQAVVSNLSLRGWQIADRWAMGAPVTVKTMERDGTLISSLKEQQKLESEIISDARVGGRYQDVPDSEILALHDVPLLPVAPEEARNQVFTVAVIDMPNCRYSSEYVYVTGFRTYVEAREYARRRSRDSLEKMRAKEAGAAANELRLLWQACGEYCLVVEGGYNARSEVEYFIEHPATAEERDWEPLKPEYKGNYFPGPGGIKLVH